MNDERTGWVKIILKYGEPRIVAAESFGEAASMISCIPGHILRFEWVSEP